MTRFYLTNGRVKLECPTLQHAAAKWMTGHGPLVLYAEHETAALILATKPKSMAEGDAMALINSSPRNAALLTFDPSAAQQSELRAQILERWGDVTTDFGTAGTERFVDHE